MLRYPTPDVTTTTPVPVGTREVGAWLLLISWLVVSRWVVAPSTLIEWDSANYVLALSDFDVSNHQPHPPGNPLFVLLLRAFTWLPGATGPFLGANAVLGAATLLALAWILRPEVGPARTWGVAAALSISPPFWFQGAASTAYVAEAAASALGGAVAVTVLRRSAPLPAAAIVLAIAIGLRPNVAIGVLPMVGACGVAAWPGWRATLKAWAVFAAGCAAWVMPLVLAGGGWSGYRKASAALWEWQVETGSVLGSGAAVATQTEALIVYLGDALNLLWGAVCVDLAVLLWQRRLDLRRVAFLAIWVGPIAAFYALHHLPKSGYALSLIPACFALWGVSAHHAETWLEGRWRIGRNLWHGAITVAWVALNATGFVVAVPAELLLLRDAPIRVPDGRVLTGDYGRIGLQYRTWPHRATTAILDDLDDDADLAVFLFGAHELLRVQMATRPDQWMAAVSVDHGTAMFLKDGVATPPFGAFQLEILKPPEGGLTHTETTVVLRTPRGLRLVLPDRALDLPLDPLPRRVVVFVPCPPCAVEFDEGPGLGRMVGGRLAWFEPPPHGATAPTAAEIPSPSE